MTGPRPNPPRHGPYAAPPKQPERLICAGRLVLAATSLLAIWLHPAEPAKYAELAYLALIAYLGYAALLLPLAWTRYGTAAAWLGAASHGVDCLAFSFFIYV